MTHLARKFELFIDPGRVVVACAVRLTLVICFLRRGTDLNHGTELLPSFAIAMALLLRRTRREVRQVSVDLSCNEWSAARVSCENVYINRPTWCVVRYSTTQSADG